MSTQPIRVMLVDDSSVVRKLLTQALAQHPEIEVVGSASNGQIALSKLTQLNPEAVILDVEMPEMDGITALTRMRATHPRLPVIMFSTLTERGANVTFDALAAGASDYVLKPSTQAGESLQQVVSKTLVPKLIALTRSRLGLAMQAAMASLGIESDPRNLAPAPASSQPRPRSSLPFTSPTTGTLALRPPLRTLATPSQRSPSLATLSQHPLASTAPAPAQTAANRLGARSLGSHWLAASTRAQGLGRRPVQVIAIATSTGGPNALAEVIPRLPRALPVPVLIVQHMPPIFTRCLAERLAARSELTVVESEGSERLSAGTVYIAPGHRHLEVVQDERGVFSQLTEGPAENSCRPSADVLFRSLVRVYGGGVLAVVLTGMGQDGARGAREIQEAGGRVIAQSGPTCVVWGMPKVIEENGIADAIVPLPEMAAAILQHVGSGLLSPRAPGNEP
jgi:two-component system chemotaxis response regulator CheB